MTSRRVSAILQLARHPGDMEIANVPLRALVQQEMERCRPLLEGKSVQLAFDSSEEVWVEAAPELASIAIGNLLQNACVFTNSGEVRVVLKPGSLVVEDTGPGIPQALRDRLFEPFTKGPDDNSTGWGLGLSIVKRVVNHLGWTIQVDDTCDRGTRFILSFARPEDLLTKK